MLTTLISLLVLALILALIWWAFSLLPFMAGVPMQILAIVLTLVLILWVCKTFGLISMVTYTTNYVFKSLVLCGPTS